MKEIIHTAKYLYYYLTHVNIYLDETFLKLKQKHVFAKYQSTALDSHPSSQKRKVNIEETLIL